MSEQMPLFDLPSSQTASEAPVTGVEAGVGALTPARPGWTLLAGPEAWMWHLIARRRYDGMLTAMCGTQGRHVDESQREIIACTACEAADLSS